jgi:hypothetical protein
MKEKIKTIKNSLSSSFINMIGSQISEKLVVIESDDWGTIRMSSKEAYNNLLKKGYPIDRCPYSKNDALESNDDLLFLFDVLNSVKGSDSNPAILTANNIVANPNFEKIKDSGYEKYYFEPFNKTLEKYPKHDQVISLYKEGMKKDVIQMQFHGREHVHVNHWLKELLLENKVSLDTFELNMFTVHDDINNSSCNSEYLNAMASYNRQDFEIISKSIKEGLQIFEKLWGFKSKTIIAPCYTWHTDLEKVFHDNGIINIQTGRAQLLPTCQEGINKVIRKYMGQRNSLNQRYTIRNVSFEPSISGSANCVELALKAIESAFHWNKPAVISSHRLNYIGWLNPKNRDKNLKLLRTLLQQIIIKWPDVKFISSDELINYYKY